MNAAEASARPCDEPRLRRRTRGSAAAAVGLGVVAACCVMRGAHAKANGGMAYTAVQLITTTESPILYVDLHARGTSGHGGIPWFPGFTTDGVHALMISGPLHRMMSLLEEHGIDVEEGMQAWGDSASAATNYRQGYQLLDNYMVRVLGGEDAWNAPHGELAAQHLAVARQRLAKFDVVLRMECFDVDANLLTPHLNPNSPLTDLLRTGRLELYHSEPYTTRLPAGEVGEAMLLQNEYDQDLFEFASRLIHSRNPSRKSYTCGRLGVQNLAQGLPFQGRTALVYNPQHYHMEVTAAYGCMLASLGFNTTTILSKPGGGYEELFACSDTVVVAEDPAALANMMPGARFDMSAVTSFPDDAPAFMEPKNWYLTKMMLEDVKGTLWNMHSVQILGDPKQLPEKMLRLGMLKRAWLMTLGEHVLKWQKLSEVTRRVTGFEQFGRMAYIYPVYPIGNMRTVTPKATAGEKRVFIVQGSIEAKRRRYDELLVCLADMCERGKDDFHLLTAGARGNLPDDLPTCLQDKITMKKHLPFEEFYGEIKKGHFIVTAVARDVYHWSQATSSVPAALLLERPLVASETLLNVYPECLRDAPIHKMVANDDLCRNVEAAYDLTPEQYDQMELEIRDCKIHLWEESRSTLSRISDIALANGGAPVVRLGTVGQ